MVSSPASNGMETCPEDLQAPSWPGRRSEMIFSSNQAPVSLHKFYLIRSIACLEKNIRVGYNERHMQLVPGAVYTDNNI